MYISCVWQLKKHRTAVTAKLDTTVGHADKILDQIG